jgi:hypothetical protein
MKINSENKFLEKIAIIAVDNDRVFPKQWTTI